MKDLVMCLSDKNRKKYFDNKLLNTIYRQFRCYEVHKHFMNLHTPKTYDEKISWLLLNKYDATYGKYADKYAVREIVKNSGFEDMLVEVYGVFTSIEDIDFSILPDKYVLMLTHGSGSKYYFINRGKYSASALKEKINEAKEYLTESMNQNYYWRSGERQYEDIPPRIICMEYLEENEVDNLSDYKIVCSKGNPIAVLVCNERNKGRDFYSLEWDYLPYVEERFRSNKIVEKPTGLEEMIHAASVLSKDLPLARVDFYAVKGKVYFGEITLTPSGGVHKYLSDFGELELGKRINIS